MLIVSHGEGWSILQFEKTRTLRPIRANGKGYLREGSLQRVYIGRDFKQAPITRVLIIKRGFINVLEMDENEFPALGYPNREAYMSQLYNQRNPSPERVSYWFVDLRYLLDCLDTLEWDLNLWEEVWQYAKLNPELSAGVEPSLIHEDCDLQDLEDALLTLQGNLREALE